MGMLTQKRRNDHKTGGRMDDEQIVGGENGKIGWKEE